MDGDEGGDEGCGDGGEGGDEWGEWLILSCLRGFEDEQTNVQTFMIIEFLSRRE